MNFGLRVIRLVNSLPKQVAQVLGRQLLRAGTPVGANYRGAVRGKSRADFIAKMGIVEEGCDEALCWMEMLIESQLVNQICFATWSTKQTRFSQLLSLRYVLRDEINNFPVFAIRNPKCPI